MITPEQLALTGTEHGHQCALFCWANQQRNDWLALGTSITYRPELAAALDLMFAIPNGGARHKAVAGKLKAEGVKAGVPDIMLPVAIWRGSIDGETGKELSEFRYYGLFIEIKKPSEKPKRVGSQGGVSEKQNDFHQSLKAQGYYVAVCYSWQEARDVILYYLGVAA